MNDQKVRLEVVKNNPLLFLAAYSPEYIKYEVAPFHKEILGILQSDDIKNVVIEAFRGSGKTTLVTTTYAVWSILGVQQKKFVLLLARTEEQARQYLANIKAQLAEGTLLRQDLGPFQEPDDEWRATSIVLPRYGARITAASVEKHVRGLTHGPHRPSVIICDDLEDLDTVKTAEEREKLFEWLTSTIMPMGDNKRTRLIVIGTNLHKDSLIARLKTFISESPLRGITRRYPIVDGNGTPLWLGQFPTNEDVESFRAGRPSEAAWQREYMLNLVDREDQVIKEEWIKRYQDLSQCDPRTYRHTVISIDPAFSEKASADYTAIVCAEVYGYGKDKRIYIKPYPVNKRGMSSDELVRCVKNLAETVGGDGQPTILVEDVGAQVLLVDRLKKEGFVYVKGVNPHGHDKRERLVLAGGYVQNGNVLFPVKGAEVLETQLLGFGTEKYNDEADSFSMLVNTEMSESDWVPMFSSSTQPEKKEWSQMTDAEKKQAELEEDLRLMKEDEERRKREF